MLKSVLLSFLYISLSFGQQCSIVVPASPLTAAGLATPYLQTGCNQANIDQTTFAQAAILDNQVNPGAIFIYNPLVIDINTNPAAPPTPILNFPVGATVAIWFNTKGTSLVLQDNGQGSIASGACINGSPDPFLGVISIFGTFAHCNALSWWTLAMSYLNSGKIVLPPLGLAPDGLPCPTIRDFFITDATPSDGVTTAYIVAANGLIAQNTTMNLANLNPITILQPFEDQALLPRVLLSLGCTPARAVDLADVNSFVTALPLNELHAAKFQAAPMAYVPMGSPLVRVANGPNLQKNRDFRAAVGQDAPKSSVAANTRDYCFGIYLNLPLRLLNLMAPLLNAPSPNAKFANNLFNYLGGRFENTFGIFGLNCFDELQINPLLAPVSATTNADNVIVAIAITPPNNGPDNPIYAATTGAAAIAVNPPAKGLSKTAIIAIAVGGGIGLLVIVGFIVAFKAHKVRNFFSGIRDGISNKMRE